MVRTLEKYLDQINAMMEIDPGDGLQDAYTTLAKLYRKRGIAGVHALIQYTVAAHLYKKGYDIYVEMPLEDGLRADVYGEAPWGRIIVEVETGFIPHHLILHGESYLKARTTYKLLLYSRLADEFALAIPGSLKPSIIVPKWVLKPPGERGQREYDEAMLLLKTYYPHRLHLLRNIRNTILHNIYIIKFSSFKVYIDEVGLDSVSPGNGANVLYIV